jgi:hypothetical protein
MITNKNDKIVVISIIIIVILFLFSSKTITSGYHFIDDHEVIRMKHDLSISSLSEVTQKWVREDLDFNMRFRPLYYIHRVCETRLFGSDFFLWSLYTGILCCISLIFFYLGMRNLKFTLSGSIIFLIISFVGPQSAIWWRLGPSESLGMVFLSLSFYFMSASLNTKKYFIKTFFFIFFLILSSLTKESFLIIIPAMIFFKIWNEKKYIWSSLKESSYKNMLLIVPLIILFIELFIIKLYVGTDYSGLESNLYYSLIHFFTTLIHFVKTYLNLIFAAIVVIIINYRLKKTLLKIDGFSFVFFLLILIPNILLYARSGLVERYLLPTTIGLGFLFVSFLKGVDENPLWFKKMAFVLVLVAFIPFAVISIIDAIDFSKEGKETKRLLTEISSNYLDGKQVMVVVDPIQDYERSISLKSYLFYENHIDLFGYPVINDNDALNYQNIIGDWKVYFEDKQFENMTSKPGLLVFLNSNVIDNFFKSSTLSQLDYLPVEIENSNFVLFKEIQPDQL